MQRKVDNLKRIQGEIKRSYYYGGEQLRLIYGPWSRREYTASNASCQRAAWEIGNFLIENVWHLGEYETQMTLKTMQVAYMDMLGMQVYTGHGEVLNYPWDKETRK